MVPAAWEDTIPMDEFEPNSLYARLRRLGLWLVLTLLGLGIFYWVPPDLRGVDLSHDAESFVFPAFAASGPDGSTVVIDDSLRSQIGRAHV